MRRTSFCAVIIGVASLVAATGGAAYGDDAAGLWTGYGDGFVTVDAAIAEVQSTGGAAGSDASAIGYEAAMGGYDSVMDQVRPGERPDPEQDSCWFNVSRPFGWWDGRQLYAEVHGDVNCNFHAKQVTYTVQFYARDAACGRECTTSGRSVTCTWTTSCRGGVAYYNPAGACSGPFWHAGRGYGTYWDSDDNPHTVYLNGKFGPPKEGASYSNYC